MKVGDVVRINKRPWDVESSPSFDQHIGKLVKIARFEVQINGIEFPDKRFTVKNFKGNFVAYYIPSDVTVLGPEKTKIIKILYEN